MGPASVTLHQSFGTHPHSSVGQHSFLLISESYSTVWMSIQDRHLGSFHIWATMNFSGINEQVFIFIPLIWNLLPSDVIIGSYSNSVSRFLTSKCFLWRLYHFPSLPAICKQYTIFPCHCQQLLFSTFETVARLLSVKCCLTMASSYIPLIEKDVEQFVMCLSPFE